MGMDNNPSTKNIVVVQDMTNGLSHVIESETNGGEDVKKYVSVVSPHGSPSSTSVPNDLGGSGD